MKKRKTKKAEAEQPSLLELLDHVEAEMKRLRFENKRLTPKPEEEKEKRAVKPRALGKGLAQLFGGPKRDSGS